MRQVASCIISLFLLATAIPTSAGEVISETIEWGRSWTLESKILGEERTILVSTPDTYENGDAHYPVLYLTDARGAFKHASATADFLARTGRMPEMIVVGVTNTDRNRDLTPTRATMTRPDGSQARFPNSGGADKFLEFFSTELMPFVESTYRTQPFEILAGHSLGGLFATHTLLTRPELFGAYIVVSPALPWDNELMLRKAREAFSAQDHLRSTLVLTVGDEPRLHESFERFESFLESTTMPGFHWTVQRFADEDHRSVVLPSYYLGLRKVFEGWMMPKDENTGVVLAGFETLRQHYIGLSTRFGYEISPPERQIDRLGRQSLRGGEIESAIKIFHYYVSQYPGSSSAHSGLGSALERQGKLEEALHSHKKALELAENLGGARLNKLQETIKRLEGQLKLR